MEPVLPLGNCFGYFVEDTKRIVVCDDACPVGRYQLVSEVPPLFDWIGREEGDFASAIGPMVATVDTAVRLQAFGLEADQIAINRPRGKEGERLASRYRLLRPLAEPPAHARTTKHPDQTCPKCGRTRIGQLIGCAKLDGKVVDEKCVTFVETPRQAGQGLFIARSSLGGNSFFSYTDMLFCTSGARRWIESEGFSNVFFAEYGEIVDE